MIILINVADPLLLLPSITVESTFLCSSTTITTAHPINFTTNACIHRRPNYVTPPLPSSFSFRLSNLLMPFYQWSGDAALVNWRWPQWQWASLIEKTSGSSYVRSWICINQQYQQSQPAEIKGPVESDVDECLWIRLFRGAIY